MKILAAHSSAQHRILRELPSTVRAPGVLFVLLLAALGSVGWSDNAVAVPGLVAAYSFDEGSGATVADASGSGNGGTAAGTTWTSSGKFGSALVFNGSSARVTVPDSASLRLTTGMTLEVWVYPTTVSSAWRDVIYKANDNYYLEGTSDNSSRPASGGTFLASPIYGTTALTANSWSHLALTYDKVTLRLYVNGVQVASAAATANIATSSNPLQIGGDDIYGQFFSGRIDEVRIYNRALSTTEVQTDMNTPVGGTVPPPVDTQPPTAPSNLTANAPSSSQINLSWTASTDNVAVTSYLVERCQGSGCSNFAQIATPTSLTFNDSGLAANTPYSYRVRATDAAANLSAYSTTASATTQPSVDVQPPTAPVNLTATAASSSQINLNWTASTDNVGVTGYLLERCQGAGCANFTQIASPSATSYSDTGLTGATSYSYRVRATDAANNLSNYSNTAVTVTQSADTQPPTAPSNLAANAASSSQINLSWAAATDNVAVTGYRVERCQGAGCSNFAQIAAPNGLSFNDSGLAASTSYSYRVRAADAAGNLGAYSVAASATTQAITTGLVAAYGFDEGSGATVADASGSGNGGTAAGTTWTSSGKFGSALVFNGSSARVTVPDSASLRLTTGMTLEVWVYPTTVSSAWRDVIYKANDNYYLEGTSDNSSRPASGGTFLASPIYGTTALTANSWSHLALTYDKVTLRLYVNGVQVASAAATANIATSSNPLQIGGDDIYGQFFSGRIDEVRIYNRALSTTEVQTDMNTPVGGTVPPPVDTQPPTAPSNLTANAPSSSQINLSWTASTDNVAVTSYLVERCQGSGCSNFAQIATPTSLTFNDSGLAANTPYSYRVRATDAAANLSAYSTTASATTQPSVDVQPPTAPVNLTATAASSSQINLNWTASTDNVGVTGYLLERCQGAGCANFTQIASPSATSYSDAGLTGATSYSYRVRATDAANNLSNYSNTAVTVTQSADTQPPTAPSNLAANAASSSQINLSWAAATDNVAVTGYRVERCQGAGCSNFAQIAAPNGLSFNDSGLAASTSYSYRVRASDAAANLSPYSNVASATTQSAPPATGLVAAYSFDEGTGASVGDSSGNSNVGVLTNTTWTLNGKYGYALAFNGSNARVTVNDALSLHLATGMTLEAWVYSTNATAAWRDVIYKGNDNYYLEGTSANSGRPAGGGTFKSSPLYAPSALAINTWSHLALTYDKATLRLYVNGIEVANAAATANIATSSNPLQIGGNTIFGQYFSGRIDEVRVYDRALSAQQIQTDMATSISGAPPSPPEVPVAVTITAPSPGATLSNSVTLAASPSANVGVGGVQFQVDGVNVGPAVLLSPYSLNLSTSQFANGSHVIGVYAWDQDGNISSVATTAVTFSNANPANPAQTGLWSGLFSWPLVAVHANLMYTGRLLAWDGQEFGYVGKVWDPVTSAFADASPSENVFCSGHVQLADGRVLVVGGHGGGHIGTTGANIFNPSTQSWSSAHAMQYPRWYPTATNLPDGRVLVMSGESNCNRCFVTIPEIYNPITNTWTSLTGAPLSLPYYPHMFVLPNGQVIATGTSENPVDTRALNVGAQTWSVVDPQAVDGGSSVMYLPGKFLKAGTSVDPDSPPPSSARTAYVLDTTQAIPAWRAVAQMAFPRTYGTLTLLPDGSVAMTGGGRTTNALDVANGVLEVELWSPTSEVWTTLAPMHAPRLYHSTAVLLPDARLLVAGGGRFNGGTAPTDQFSAEIFAPPYLFKGPRPTITSAPAQLLYGQVFNVLTPAAGTIAKAALIAPANVTHTINMNQRYLPLTFTASAGNLSVTAPANPNLAPPGYYMLFIVDTNGVPSVSKFVKF